MEDGQAKKDEAVKIILLGDSAVGKTKLVDLILFLMQQVGRTILNG